MEHRVVAIVGPSGVGKSTVGWGVSRKLGFEFVDVGLVWRVLGSRLLDQGLDPSDESACLTMAEALDFTATGLGWVALQSGTRLDLSHLARRQVADYASKSTAHPSVRRRVAETISALYAPTDVVAVGRPYIYEEVFPETFMKVMLTADTYVRAARNQDTESLAEMTERDVRDGMNGTFSSFDATIDCGNLEVGSIENTIIRLVRQRMPEGQNEA
jgi:cytidylate kinase